MAEVWSPAPRELPFKPLSIQQREARGRLELVLQRPRPWWLPTWLGAQGLTLMVAPKQIVVWLLAMLAICFVALFPAQRCVSCSPTTLECQELSLPRADIYDFRLAALGGGRCAVRVIHRDGSHELFGGLNEEEATYLAVVLRNQFLCEKEEGVTEMLVG